MNLRKAAARALGGAGFEAARWIVDDACWNPGYRLVRVLPGRIRLYYEGPDADAAYFLDAYTGELRAAGYVVERGLPQRRFFRPVLVVRPGTGQVGRDPAAEEAVRRPGLFRAAQHVVDALEGPVKA